MLKIVRQRLDVQFDDAQAAAFQRLIDERLNPLISGVRREYFKRLGADTPEGESWTAREQAVGVAPLVLGDVVVRDRDTVAYYRLPRGERGLEAGVITRGDVEKYRSFFDDVMSLASSASGRPDLAWTPAAPEKGEAEALAVESSVVMPSSEEVEAARALEVEGAQQLMAQIFASGSVFLTRFSQTQGHDRAATESHIARLESLGLVSKDYAVLCRKTGQQILRVSSRAAIEDPSQKTFKCFICGNSVSEEVLDEIITVTDFGRKLLERDYWLAVRALGALASIGVPSGEVRVQPGDDKLTNFFLTVHDQRYLIVLANQKITLESSYLINAQVAAYHLSHVIVVSTERVSTLMRAHLEKSNPSTAFDFVDSLSALEERLAAVFSRKERAVLRDVFADFGSLTPVQVQDVVMQRVTAEGGDAAQRERKDGERGDAGGKGGRRGRGAKDEGLAADSDARVDADAATAVETPPA